MKSVAFRDESPLSRDRLHHAKETFSNFIFNRQQALHQEALEEANKKFRQPTHKFVPSIDNKSNKLAIRQATAATAKAHTEKKEVKHQIMQNHYPMFNEENNDVQEQEA